MILIDYFDDFCKLAKNIELTFTIGMSIVHLRWFVRSVVRAVHFGCGCSRRLVSLLGLPFRLHSLLRPLAHFHWRQMVQTPFEGQTRSVDNKPSAGDHARTFHRFGLIVCTVERDGPHSLPGRQLSLEGSEIDSSSCKIQWAYLH